MAALKYAEDIEVGAVFDLGSYEMRREEIAAFKDHWDPGVMRAEGEVPGRQGDAEPIASGVHSIALQQRLVSLGALHDWAIVAGRRLREVAFVAPVRAGMRIAGEMVVDEILPRSGRSGVVVFTVTLRHEGDVVLKVVHEAIVLRRPDLSSTPVFGY